MSASASPSPGQHPLQLDIFAPHGVLQKFRFMGRSRTALVATALASLLAFLLAAAADGNLIQGSLHKILCQDARSYVNASHKICNSYGFAQDIVALRDLGTLAVACLLPLTIPLMFRQWEGITHFLRAMDERGILRIGDRTQVDHEVSLCNQYFRRWGSWNPLVCLVAVLFMLLVVGAEASGRVYPILKTSSRGYGVLPEHWWASIIGPHLAGILYFTVGFVVIYIILLQNVHGARVVFLLWRLRTLVIYEADVTNQDGSYGWSEVKAILFATWSLTIVHGLCLGLVALSLPKGEATAVAPLLLQWVIVTPFYIIIPVWLTRRNLTAWKRRGRTVFESRIAAATTQAARSQLSHEMRTLVRVKVNPYAGVVRRTFHYLGLIGSIVLVIQVVQYIYK